MKKLILGWMAAGLLAAPLAAQAVAVKVGNREWRQLTETRGFSWNQMATVCDSTTGACSGSLGGVSFDGWTWAAHTDLQGLFQALIPSGSFPTDESNFIVPGAENADIAAMLSGAPFFEPTIVDGRGRRVLIGVSRTTRVGDSAAVAQVSDDQPDDDESADAAFLGARTAKSSAIADWGVWLYRDVSAVPDPATAFLLAGGLVGLLGLSRRRPGKSSAV